MKEAPVDIVDKIKSSPLFKRTKSKLRLIANLKMEHAMKLGFSILLLGERGTGKSKFVEKYGKSKTIIGVNCASFDDDHKAESELFGYLKGAFTGANNDKDGLFQQANGGILFLDEIHLLSKRVQEKLMKALQTDEHNFYYIRKMNATTTQKIKCQVIIASNRTISALKHKYLYPDFFDRISQQVIELPALRTTPEDRQEDWKDIWVQMKFGNREDAPQEKPFILWLKQQNLHGNFRDLQKIAIYWHGYNNFNKQLKNLLKKENIHTPFQYTKNEFAKSISINPQKITYFNLEHSIQDMQNKFQKDLAHWLHKQFGSIPKASAYFQEKFGKTIQTRTLYKWKNGK